MLDELVEQHGDFDLALTDEDVRRGYVLRDGEPVVVQSLHQYALWAGHLDDLAGKYDFSAAEQESNRTLLAMINSGRITKAPGYVLYKPVEVHFEEERDGRFTAWHTVPTLNPEVPGESTMHGRDICGEGQTRREAAHSLFNILSGFQRDMADGTPLGPEPALMRDYFATLFRPIGSTS